MNVEQTEFWAEESATQTGVEAPPRRALAEDYFANEPADVCPCARPVEDLGPPVKLQVSEPVEAIEQRRTEEALRAHLEAIDVELQRKALRLSPLETVESGRPTVVRRSSTPVPRRAPRFNMTRLLTLTGSLDSAERGDRLMQLPRRAYRAVVTLLERRSFSRDILKDLRTPPRNATVTKF